MKGSWHILLIAWYLLAVTGINIHRDAEHGRTYVVPSLIGCDCELIHPAHHCHDMCREDGCLEGEDCCSNDFHAVVTQGEDTDGVPSLPLRSVCFIALPLSAALPVCLFSRRADHGGPPLSPPVASPFERLRVLRI